MLAPFGRQRRRGPRQQLAGICLLLSIQPIRTAVLQYISAYDAAKLDLLRLLFLTSWERERYLKPIRDLVWDTDEQEALSREGMRLVLLGGAVHVLGQRLNQTRQYQAAQGNRKLRVYLVGAFPIPSRSPDTLKRLINFSISGESSPMRALGDEYHLRHMQWAMGPGELKTFLMAFGAPMALSSGRPRGIWHRVSDIPDRTIDLRVYVPTFCDRSREEVRITSRDLLHLSRLGNPSHVQLKRASMPEQWARAMHRLCKIVVGRSSVPVGVLTEQGEMPLAGTAVQLSFLLDVGLYSSLHATVWIS